MKYMYTYILHNKNNSELSALCDLDHEETMKRPEKKTGKRPGKSNHGDQEKAITGNQSQTENQL